MAGAGTVFVVRVIAVAWDMMLVVIAGGGAAEDSSPSKGEEAAP
jgi:hypothetical protein